jgi:hypothetical protein
VRLSLKLGKHLALGRLAPEQQAVIERLEREDITPDEAERLLGGIVSIFDLSIGTAAADGELPEVAAAASPETAEEEIARRLVERIAEEVDAETAG